MSETPSNPSPDSPVPFADPLGDALRAVAERLGPAVVGVAGHRSHGSGVVVADGVVVTCAHNLTSDTPTVLLPDGRQVEATVAGADLEGDLAVLTLDTGDLPAVEVDAEVDVRPGDPVVALANPGGRGVRVTAGRISAVDVAFRGPGGHRITGNVEHTAPLPRGASGGPVVTVDGRLVGIDTHRLGDGFYAAQPAGTLAGRIDTLRRGETPKRRRLGVGLASSATARRLREAVGLEGRDGLLVRAVDDDGPAAAAGIETGDLLVRAAGRDLHTVDDLRAALDGGGDTVELVVVRGVEERTVTVSF